ncbi:GDP-L-fucose synthase, partial [Alphaproteobacteria bacterium]|nr:GDP-L-fucose synthase [Alphaproteobacteria bacterium]
MIKLYSKIYVAGHNGMVGSSILRELKKKNFKNIITRSKKQLDLLDQKKTFQFLKISKPDAVIICAARVGGINANNIYRAQYIYENTQIQNNLIHGSYLSGVKKLIFLGSSCIYPRNCKQPIKEEYLLSGKLEYSNEPYAIAKINGLKMCENYNKQYKLNYLCLMPCNMYGPNDNYDLNSSHFLPALIKKIHTAKKEKQNKITLWGNGKAKRELMHVDDFASACLHFLKIKTKHSLVNIGSNEEYSIKKFAKKIMKHIAFKAKIDFDYSMPNGTPRKILNSNLANNYGWY